MRQLFRNLLLFGMATAVCVACSKENDVTKQEEQKKETSENTTEEVKIVDGAITAVFSVSETKKVYFSKGNLQYKANTNTWRFAENQYDAIGEDNKNISSTYDGWIDLFGWGTSGWNSGANAYQPYSISTEISDYYPGGSEKNDLTGDYANADWGVYNTIIGGGNKVGLWRTLSYNEWYYLLKNRKTADQLYGLAIINGINGIVLLPDTWTQPQDVFFEKGITKGYSQNIYSIDNWMIMEKNGAVFLPATGLRKGADITRIGVGGHYWSSSANIQGIGSGCIVFQADLVELNNIDNYSRCGGRAVRLVQDVK